MNNCKYCGKQIPLKYGPAYDKKAVYCSHGCRGRAMVGIKQGHRTEEEKKHLSAVFTGRKLSEETKRKLSEIHKRIGTMPPSNKGTVFSLEHRRKISISNTGKTHSPETRLKLSILRKGRKQSAETVQKRRLSLLGPKSPLWRGGISFLPYTTDWTDTLKRSIRERDHYICMMCGAPQERKLLDVHHIDYNKKNCDPHNLITLCSRCHVKTSHNRESWKELFSRYGTEAIF